MHDFRVTAFYDLTFFRALHFCSSLHQSRHSAVFGGCNNTISSGSYNAVVGGLVRVSQPAIRSFREKLIPAFLFPRYSFPPLFFFPFLRS
jgi:hypothetical protein